MVSANCKTSGFGTLVHRNFSHPLCRGLHNVDEKTARVCALSCRNIPSPSNMRHARAGSATRTALTDLSGIGSQRYRRCFSASHSFRALESSSQDAVEQEPGRDPEVVQAADDANPESRPFPKVGDVVRYEGKWENEVSFGEVSRYPCH